MLDLATALALFLLGAGTVYAIAARRLAASRRRMAALTSEVERRTDLENRLRASEGRLKGILDHMNDWVWEADENGVFTYSSPHTLEWLGLPPEEVVGRKAPIAPFEEDLPEERQLLEGLLANPRPVVGVLIRLQARDGRGVTIETNASPFFDEEGVFRGYRGVSRDVTERKLAEEALQENEARYRTIVEDQTEMIVRWLPNGTRLFANDAYRRTLGETRDREVAGSTWYRTSSEDRTKSLLAKLTPEQPAATGLCRALLPGGAVAWHSWTDRAFFDSDGKLVEVQSVGRDVTLQKQTEDALRESEERYRTLVENAAEAIVVLDVDSGRFVDCNENATRLYGCDREVLLRNGPVDFSPPFQPEGRRSEEAAADRIRAAVEGEKPVFEWIHQNTAGDLIPCEIRLVRIPSAGQRVVRGSVTDITARKKAEAELERQRQKLVEADKMAALGTLISGVAHEVNNPNHYILLNLPILGEAWRDATRLLDELAPGAGDFRLAGTPYHEIKDEIPELLDEVRDGAERIKRIVGELHNFTRSQSASAIGPVSLNEVVDASLTLTGSAIRKATESFDLELAPDLPVLPGNAHRLEQVVINLLLNACQALTARSQAIRVTTYHDRPAAEVVLEVYDEGRGIAAEDLPHVRDPFYTTKRDTGGTGLGLAVSARIVEEHGGRLEHESAPGRGTTARVALPADRTEDI